MKHGRIKKYYHVGTDRISVSLRVAGYECTGIIDTGASLSCIPLCVAYKAGLINGDIQLSADTFRTDSDRFCGADIVARLEILQEANGESIIEIDGFKMSAIITGSLSSKTVSPDSIRQRASYEARTVDETDKLVLLGLDLLKCGGFSLSRHGDSIAMTLEL